MSVIAVMIAVGSQAAAVRREEVRSIGEPIRFEQPIAPAVDQYQGCLQRRLRAHPFVPSRVEQTFEGAIRTCATERSDALEVADEALKKAGWSDPARRRASIQQTFDEIDADHRRHGQRLKEQLDRKLMRTGNERG